MFLDIQSKNMNTRMIEVFKTNVQEVDRAGRLVALLLDHFPGSKINFDLDDCDKVLRIEGKNFAISKVISIVRENGFNCSALE